ncbi:MAG: hypothetical protein ACOYD7_06940 [Raoultibacter sp.]
MPRVIDCRPPAAGNRAWATDCEPSASILDSPFEQDFGTKSVSLADFGHMGGFRASLAKMLDE